MANILLFGAGAIGAVYVYTFMQAGAKVTAVCRSNFDTVKKNGFEMQSIRFRNVRFTPEVVRTAEEAASLGTTWDFIVVCSKCMPGSTPSLGDLIKPAVGPKTAIVLIQNGINIEIDIAAMYPENPLLSCVVYLPTTQVRSGVIDYGASQNETLNILEIGTYPSTAPQWHKDAAYELCTLVQKGGGNAKVFDDIQPRRWGKITVNAAWNPLLPCRCAQMPTS